MPSRKGPVLVVDDDRYILEALQVNGPQFMAEVAKDVALSSVPVVLVTADARAAEKAKSNPFAGYLTKPLNLEALFDTVGGYGDKRDGQS